MSEELVSSPEFRTDEASSPEFQTGEASNLEFQTGEASNLEFRTDELRYRYRQLLVLQVLLIVSIENYNSWL